MHPGLLPVDLFGIHTYDPHLYHRGSRVFHRRGIIATTLRDMAEVVMYGAESHFLPNEPTTQVLTETLRVSSAQPVEEMAFLMARMTHRIQAEHARDLPDGDLIYAMYCDGWRAMHVVRRRHSIWPNPYEPYEEHKLAVWRLPSTDYDSLEPEEGDGFEESEEYDEAAGEQHPIHYLAEMDVHVSLIHQQGFSPDEPTHTTYLLGSLLQVCDVEYFLSRLSDLDRRFPKDNPARIFDQLRIQTDNAIYSHCTYRE